MYGNKYYFLAVLFILCTANYSFQCNKRIGCADAVYNFEVAIKAYPDKDSVHVGDTIWLRVGESVNLMELRTGRIVNYSNAANLGSAIAFHKLSDANQFTTGAAAQHFEFKLLNGTETNNAATYLHEYLFEENNNHYLFELGVVPIKQGVYRIGFSNAANVYRKNDKCTKATLL